MQRKGRQSLDYRDGQGLGCRRAESRRTPLGDCGGRFVTVSGAQLAVDTTNVSPLHGDGIARRGAALCVWKVLREARRRKERSYPELSGMGGRARLVVLTATVGVRCSQETAQFGKVSPASSQKKPQNLCGNEEAGFVASVAELSRVHRRKGFLHCPSSI